MNTLLEKVKKLSEKQAKELAALCAVAGLLLLAAGCLSGGLSVHLGPTPVLTQGVPTPYEAATVGLSPQISGQ